MGTYRGLCRPPPKKKEKKKKEGERKRGGVAKLLPGSVGTCLVTDGGGGGSGDGDVR